MIAQWTPKWEDCTKEEYNSNDGDNNPGYDKQPYYNTPFGILEQIKFIGKSPDGYRYRKKVGMKLVYICNKYEADYLIGLKKKGRLWHDTDPQIHAIT